MELRRLTVGPLQENCYLLADPVSRRAVLVDPGDEAERLLAALEQEKWQLQAVWLTHAHFDHVGALADVHEAHGVPTFMHPADAPLLARAAESAARWEIALRPPPTEYQAITPDQILTLGETQVHCLFTPGHAPGHIAFYLPDHGTLLAGDALFRGSIGRTDLPGGDTQLLLDSIKTKLLTLPPDTRVYPGHGPETFIGHETKTNPFLA